MSLPVLNDSPKYETIIPSTGKKVKFRPYLVREEKVLLLAMESQDPKQIINAMLDTIGACYQNIDTNALTTFDVEFLFIQVRAKSVGESIETLQECAECSAKFEYNINLDNVKCEGGDVSNMVDIGNNMTIEMRYPTYRDIEIVEDEKEMGINLIAGSMLALITEDERIEIADEPKEEVIRFVESMTSSQFESVTQFIESMKVVKYEDDIVCPKCGAEKHIEFKGLQDFF